METATKSPQMVSFREQSEENKELELNIFLDGQGPSSRKRNAAQISQRPDGVNKCAFQKVKNLKNHQNISDLANDDARGTSFKSMKMGVGARFPLGGLDCFWEEHGKTSILVD